MPARLSRRDFLKCSVVAGITVYIAAPGSDALAALFEKERLRRCRGTRRPAGSATAPTPPRRSRARRSSVSTCAPRPARLAARAGARDVAAGDTRRSRLCGLRPVAARRRDSKPDRVVTAADLQRDGVAVPAVLRRGHAAAGRRDAGLSRPRRRVARLARFRPLPRREERAEVPRRRDPLGRERPGRWSATVGRASATCASAAPRLSTTTPIRASRTRRCFRWLQQERAAVAAGQSAGWDRCARLPHRGRDRGSAGQIRPRQAAAAARILLAIDRHRRVRARQRQRLVRRGHRDGAPGRGHAVAAGSRRSRRAHARRQPLRREKAGGASLLHRRLRLEGSQPVPVLRADGGPVRRRPRRCAWPTTATSNSSPASSVTASASATASRSTARAASSTIFQGDMVGDGGGRQNFSPSVCLVAATAAQSIYYFPRSDLASTVIASRALDAGSARGYGTLQSMGATEMLVDEVAAELGHRSDRAAPAQRVHDRHEEHAGRDSRRRACAPTKCWRKARAHPLWRERGKRKREYEAAHPGKRYGVGFGCVQKDFGTGAEAAFAEVALSTRRAASCCAIRDRDGHRHGHQPGGAVRAMARPARPTKCAPARPTGRSLPMFATDDPWLMQQAVQDAQHGDPRWTPNCMTPEQRQQLGLFLRSRDARSGAVGVHARLVAGGAGDLGRRLRRRPAGAAVGARARTRTGSKANSPRVDSRRCRCRNSRRSAHELGLVDRRDRAHLQSLAMGGGRVPAGWR